ncbi:hypothetical protein ABT297_24020 [Dactylosporangium sp. NPDC000555]|uniref:hypothetical protein n=1 Tax=Dactylosporangium sp. NPDC000555 TaxID=3154260 RepID=UPI0033180D79
MEPQSRALPTSDLEAIFGVLVTVHGELTADELQPDLVRRLLRRLTDHGPLPAGASTGELNALLADLCQRMHWAMSADYGDYPEPRPRRTTYYLDIPDEAEAVDACMAALTDLGGEVSFQGIERPSPNRRQLAAAFPDLPPDPSHHARIAQLSSLASRYGGRFAGFGG